MTYLIWTLLNYAAIIFFVFICFRALKLVKRETGMLSAMILVLGLLALATRRGEEKDLFVPEPEDASQLVPIQASDNRNTAGLSTITISDYIGTELHMHISFFKGVIDEPMQVRNVSFSLEGLVGGHNWKPTSVTIRPAKNKETYDYAVDGILKWNLAGITLYSQKKHFSGSVNLK